MPSQSSEERTEVLRDRARRLGAIKDNAGWLELRAEYERKRERWIKSHLLSPMSIDLRELDFKRGFWAGCQWLLDNPEMAEKSLQEALSRADRVKED